MRIKRETEGTGIRNWEYTERGIEYSNKFGLENFILFVVLVFGLCIKRESIARTVCEDYVMTWEEKLSSSPVSSLECQRFLT